MMAVVADSHLAAELALDSASHDADTLIRNLEMSLESRANTVRSNDLKMGQSGVARLEFQYHLSLKAIEH